ncbi:MAG: SDR family NAD(P)-dependent oxidoreductase [Jatrophihabitans sp.]
MSGDPPAASPRGTVLVTGASRGIGRECALRLAAAGYDLVLWARSAEELDETREQAARSLTRVSVRVVDVIDAEQVAAGYAEIEATGPLAGLVLNAGSGIWQPITEISDAIWDETLATNLRSAMLILRHALPGFRQAGGGLIVGILSDSARFAFPGRAAYSASKAGLAALLEVTRREVRDRGVRVSALVPSRVDTSFQGSMAVAGPGSRPGSLSATAVADVIGWLFDLPPELEVRELQLAALTAPFGPYEEKVST